jgi:hypothetical protein
MKETVNKDILGVKIDGHPLPTVQDFDEAEGWADVLVPRLSKTLGVGIGETLDITEEPPEFNYEVKRLFGKITVVRRS